MMEENILQVAFIAIMPYLAPIVLILSAIKIAESLSDLIRDAFGSNQKRRFY